MALFFYHLALFLYQAGIRVAAFFGNPKARLWLEGRKDIWEKLEQGITPGEHWVWMHCSSLGEFEQGRPVLEKWRQKWPGHKLLLTFFSPSGYEQRKAYKGADLVAYIPLDGRTNAHRFLDIVKPRVVFFVKYDYWFHYLKTCHDRKIPLFILSAIFRRSQPFFKWYGGLHRKMLGYFSRLFVQDQASLDLLEKEVPGLPVTVAGDTRFDRVAEIARASALPPLLTDFCRDNQVMVAGSTWAEDEQLISQALKEFPGLKLVIAPHEIHEKHLQQVEALFPESIRYSRFDPASPARVMIIDNIGMLSSLYRVATVSYVGGGFGSGIHNTLEAAVYNVAVIFGPNYQRFREAVELVSCGAGFAIQNKEDLVIVLNRMLKDEDARKIAAEKAGDYVEKGRGATERILREIQA